MLLRVLGTAAGGGIPQWNCACPGCSGARRDPRWRRRHASLAVRASDGTDWYVVNAGPDLTDQLEDAPPLRPGPGRSSPVAGVVLTDAELDHTLGLARLREADALRVHATAPVRGALTAGLRLGAVLAPYLELTWTDLGPDHRPLSPTRPTVPGGSGGSGGSGGGLRIAAVPVSAKRPRYAAGLDIAPDTVPGMLPEGDQDGGPGGGPGPGAWVSALSVRDPVTGGSLLYAPALGSWPEELQRAAERADCVIVDGTFWDDDEPVRTGISARTATGMGHLPITGPGGTAERLGKLSARCLYTHLNNTNPLVDPAAPQHRLLAEQGLEVASDGMEIEL
ncbi:pyrroloquinoline quinone biosynthesis protein PqqB [Streptomyces sp. NPDC090025]|uniref:pyrroloquinoline quinone biosynthesis protein PqqB n=1 Tax=Streptomyces sp. NPDC090025 TaxID=3365922 RepID=UPI0038368254